MQNAALYRKGMKTRREVLGKQRESEIATEVDDFSRPIREFTTKYVWGEIWSRKGFPRKTRSLINIGLLTALKCPQELKTHIRGALNNGCTKEEIREALIHVACYAGFPATIDAFRSAKKALDELDGK